MTKSFLVEIVVCEYVEDDDGKRWTARGRVVHECPTKDAAQALAERLVVLARPLVEEMT